MDTSIHDWIEGRGEEMVLITMIDDATSRVLARFYPADTIEAHLDLLGRWLRQYGRPLALYTDRHSIFEPQEKGQADPDGETQFGRALARAGHRADPGPQPAGQGTGGALLRHGPGSLGQGAASGQGEDHRRRPTRCWSGCCPSTTGASACRPRRPATRIAPLGSGASTWRRS